MQSYPITFIILKREIPHQMLLELPGSIAMSVAAASDHLVSATARVTCNAQLLRPISCLFAGGSSSERPTFAQGRLFPDRNPPASVLRP